MEEPKPKLEIAPVKFASIKRLRARWQHFLHVGGFPAGGIIPRAFGLTALWTVFYHATTYLIKGPDHPRCNYT